MTNSFHFPPDVFNLLVDTIPLLNRSKKDVLTFFRGAGVPDFMLKGYHDALRSDPESVRKFEVVRTLLTKLNEGGDSFIRQRREVVRRVVEFSDFSACWPDDMLKAEALVGRITKLVDLKDTTTRLESERKHKEIEERRTRAETAAREAEEKERAKKAALEEFRAVLLEPTPQKRGKRLEGAVNSVFKQSGILVREAFELRDDETGKAIEQIDGVVQIDSRLYLVEMKWWNAPLGPGDTAKHLVNVFTRDVGGIYISATGFTEAAIRDHERALAQSKTVVMCRLDHVVSVLEAGGDLVDALRERIRAAQIDRKPFLP